MMTVPDGLDPLQHRAEMTSKYAARTLDMVRTAWACTACSAPVPPPPAMVLPFSNYRSAAQAGETVSSAASAAIADGAGHDPCPACGSASRLVTADMHVFSSALGRDLVFRFAPGSGTQVLGWALAEGYAPLAVTPDVERAVARDAIFRTIAAKREDDEDAEACALVPEAIRTMPGDPDLLLLMPWLARLGQLDLGSALAAAHAAARPDDAAGPYWRAQMIVEAVGKGRAPRDAIDQAVPLLQQAVALRPDYPDAQIGLANVARVRGRDPEAEQALRALLARHPEHPEANYTLGLILLPTRPAEALPCFERGEAQAPRDADYPRSRARALLALGRTAEARAAISRAKELAPDDARVDQVMAQIASGKSPGSGSKGMTLAIRAVVAVVLLGVAITVGVFVLGAMRGATVGAPPAARPPAPAAPPPAAPPPAPPKRK